MQSRGMKRRSLESDDCRRARESRGPTLKRVVPGLIIGVAALATMMVLTASASAAPTPALTWSSAKTVAPDTITDIDCPSSSLCVAVDVSGNVITSTNPNGPAADWTATDVIASSLHAVSCASPSLCVAVSTAGQLVTSTDPTGGAAAWTTTKISGVGHLGAVDCAVGVCAALDADAKILLSSNPTGGAGAWTVGEPSGTSLFLSAIDCPSSALCVAVGAESRNLGGGFFVQENVVFTLTDPVGPGRQAERSYLGPRSFMQAISCPATSFCLAVDKSGEAWASSDPTGGESAWSNQFIDAGEELTDVSCPSPSFCVAVDKSGHALTSVDPTEGMSAWGVADIPAGLLSLSCPSASLCLAAGLNQVASGTPPPPEQPQPSQPSTPSQPAQAFVRPHLLLLHRVVMVWYGRAKLALTCYPSCSGVARLELKKGRRSKGARGAFRSSGAVRFAITGNKRATIRLSKKDRELLDERKQLQGRVRISAHASTGQPLSLEQIVTLKKRGS